MRRCESISTKRLRRARRVRARLRGTATHPRLSVFRSHTHIYAQLIDDTTGRTLLALSDRMVKEPAPGKHGRGAVSSRRKEYMAFLVGKELGERARKQGIVAARFDRGPYQYHGRVARVSEGARAAGLRL